jgi:hypothetical protein
MIDSQLVSIFELFEQEIKALKQQQTGLNQETIDKLKSGFNKATESLDDTALDFNFRLHIAVENTKNDIDVKVESLKCRLNLIRDSMFMDLDNQEEQLRT